VAADLHADLSQDTLRLVDDLVDQLGREDLEAGSAHRLTVLIE
jgi:hypothetical protein